MKSHLSDGEQSELVARLAALAHPARLQIVRGLAELDCCCCKEVVGRLELAQSTVSQHLKVLVEAGLVELTPQGQRSLYRLDRQALASLSGSISSLVAICCTSSSAAEKKTRTTG